MFKPAAAALKGSSSDSTQGNCGSAATARPEDGNNGITQGSHSSTAAEKFEAAMAARLARGSSDVCIQGSIQGSNGGEGYGVGDDTQGSRSSTSEVQFDATAAALEVGAAARVVAAVTVK